MWGAFYPYCDRSLAHIDLHDPLTDHPLNVGRLFWLLPLPGRYGGLLINDLVKAAPGTLNNFGSGTGWRGPLISGEYGSWLGTAASGCYISVPGSNLLWVSLPFTIGVTIQTTATLNEVVFECNGNSGFSVQVGAVSPVGSASCWVGLANKGVQTTNAINDGKPHRLLFVLESSGTVYVDGASGGSAAGSPSPPSYSGAPYYLFSRAGSYGLDGSIGNATVWDRPLSAGEAAAEFALLKQGYPGMLRRRRTPLHGAASAPIVAPPESFLQRRIFSYYYPDRTLAEL